MPIQQSGEPVQQQQPFAAPIQVSRVRAPGDSLLLSSESDPAVAAAADPAARQQLRDLLQAQRQQQQFIVKTDIKEEQQGQLLSPMAQQRPQFRYPLPPGGVVQQQQQQPMQGIHQQQPRPVFQQQQQQMMMQQRPRFQQPQGLEFRQPGPAPMLAGNNALRMQQQQQQMVMQRPPIHMQQQQQQIINRPPMQQMQQPVKVEEQPVPVVQPCAAATVVSNEADDDFADLGLGGCNIDDDELLGLGNDFNILEYADPELHDSMGQEGAGGSGAEGPEGASPSDFNILEYADLDGAEETSGAKASVPVPIIVPQVPAGEQLDEASVARLKKEAEEKAARVAQEVGEFQAKLLEFTQHQKKAEAGDAAAAAAAALANAGTESCSSSATTTPTRTAMTSPLQQGFQQPPQPGMAGYPVTPQPPPPYRGPPPPYPGTPQRAPPQVRSS